MKTLSANEAKSHFGDMLMKVQRAPVQINKNGRPVAVVLSVDEYETIESLKLNYLKDRAAQAVSDIEEGRLVDSREFFSSLLSDKTLR